MLLLHVTKLLLMGKKSQKVPRARKEEAKQRREVKERKKRKSNKRVKFFMIE